jgi:hypothetical protein
MPDQPLAYVDPGSSRATSHGRPYPRQYLEPLRQLKAQNIRTRSSSSGRPRCTAASMRAHAQTAEETHQPQQVAHDGVEAQPEGCRMVQFYEDARGAHKLTEWSLSLESHITASWCARGRPGVMERRTAALTRQAEDDRLQHPPASEQEPTATSPTGYFSSTTSSCGSSGSFISRRRRHFPGFGTLDGCSKS